MQQVRWKQCFENFKKTFQDGLIQDGQTWLKVLQSRDETMHIYNEITSQKITKAIQNKYFQIIESLYHTLKQRHVEN